MDFREILKFQLNEYQKEAERHLDGMTEQERRFMPSDSSHHIDFALWHSIRAEDILLNYGSREEEQLWIRGGWAEKFGIPASDIGVGYTSEQVRNMPSTPIENLMAYYQAVRNETFEYISKVDAKELDKRCPFNALHHQLPDVTKGGVLAHIVVETSQHLGQIGYIRGIIRGMQ